MNDLDLQKNFVEIVLARDTQVECCGHLDNPWQNKTLQQVKTEKENISQKCRQGHLLPVDQRVTKIEAPI